MYRTIMVPLDGSDKARPAMELAFMVGRDFSANVEGFHVRADPKTTVPLMGEGMSGAMIEEMINLAEQESADRARVARRMFDEHCANYDIPQGAPETGSKEVTATWSEVVDREDEAVARHGRIRDMLVVGRPVSGEEQPSPAILNAALFETGRPVLVAPPELPTHVGRTVAVAWNGSAQAARAMAGGLPFLHRADRVLILTADTDATAAGSAEDVTGYLRWHGIEAESVPFSPAGHAVGEAMLLECRKVKADLLVMGAYTHSRVRQLILVGVTHHVLDNAEIPLLMGH